MNSTLTELKLANQAANFTQAAEEQLAEAIDSNRTLARLTIDLRNRHAKEVIERALLRNRDGIRRRRVASASDGGASSQPLEAAQQAVAAALARSVVGRPTQEVIASKADAERKVSRAPALAHRKRGLAGTAVTRTCTRTASNTPMPSPIA